MTELRKKMQTYVQKHRIVAMLIAGMKHISKSEKN